MKRAGLLCMMAIVCMLVFAPAAHAVHLDLSDGRIDADGKGLKVEKIIEREFFVRERTLAPGDTIRRSYVIVNSYTHDYDLFLRADNAYNTPVERDLLSNIYLTLTLDGKTIFDGTIAGERDRLGRTMEEEIYLGRIKEDTNSRLTAVFEVEGPGLGNEWQGSQADVDWIFRAVRHERPTPSAPETPGTIRPPGGPKTGDYAQMLALLLLLLAAAALVAKMQKKRRSGPA